MMVKANGRVSKEVVRKKSQATVGWGRETLSTRCLAGAGFSIAQGKGRKVSRSSRRANCLPMIVKSNRATGHERPRVTLETSSSSTYQK